MLENGINWGQKNHNQGMSENGGLYAPAQVENFAQLLLDLKVSKGQAIEVNKENPVYL